MTMKADIDYAFYHVEDHLPPYRLRITARYDNPKSFASNLMWFEHARTTLDGIRLKAQDWLNTQGIWYACQREHSLGIVFYFFDQHNAMLLRLYMDNV